MKIIIAVKGAEREDYLRRVASLIPWRDAETILLLHVVDVEPRSGLDVGRERYFGRRPLHDRRAIELVQAEEERARATLAFARAALLDAGIPETILAESTLRGRPRETIRDHAEHEGYDLIVVGARPGRPGPHSLGKTARFLVDHAPVAALVVR
jgi:nucleotide-binding universal stress UspA family protein